jgi:hypothetical protein
VTDRTGEESLDDRILTPAASAVVALVLAVVSLTGQGSWNTAIQSFLGNTFGAAEYQRVLAVGAGMTLAVSAAAMWLAWRVVGRRRPVSSWDEHLARAALVLAGLASLFALLTILGSLTAPAGGFGVY